MPIDLLAPGPVDLLGGQSSAAKQIAADPITQAAMRPNLDYNPNSIYTRRAQVLGQSAPGSAVNFLGGVYNMLRHPLDTGGALLDVAAGGLKKLTPAPVESAISSLDWNPQAAQRAEKTVETVGEFYKQRYGSLEQAKETALTDPVGAAADVSMALGIGAGLTPKASTVGRILRSGSQITNPMTPIVKGSKAVVKPLAAAAGDVTKQVLGLTTGAGAESVSQAAKSGYAGKTSFLKNMRGEMPFASVLDDAKAALLRMKNAKSRQYRSGMVDISKDAKQLDFGPIDDAIRDAKAMAAYKGQVTNVEAARKVSEMSKIVDDWLRLEPDQFHTPEGFDALKQKLGSVLESIPYEQRTARAAAGKIYHAVKQTIVDQSPSYAKVMKDYSEAADLISEIERTLSLKPTASVDTAVRKLQSLLRNNATTNYGNRLRLAQQLEAQGGADLMPALAGQSMSAWTPRGLIGQGGMLGTTLYSGLTAQPGALAALPLMSPRTVGNVAYGVGRVARGVANLAEKAPSEQMMLLSLMLQRAGVSTDDGQ